MHVHDNSCTTLSFSCSFLFSLLLFLIINVQQASSSHHHVQDYYSFFQNLQRRSLGIMVSDIIMLWWQMVKYLFHLYLADNLYYFVSLVSYDSKIYVTLVQSFTYILQWFLTRIILHIIAFVMHTNRLIYERVLVPWIQVMYYLWSKKSFRQTLQDVDTCKVLVHTER